MTSSRSFETDFVKNHKNVVKLKKLLENSECDEIAEVIIENANESLGLKIWSSTLSLMKDEEKLLKLVENVSIFSQNSSVCLKFVEV